MNRTMQYKAITSRMGGFRVKSEANWRDRWTNYYHGGNLKDLCQITQDIRRYMNIAVLVNGENISIRKASGLLQAALLNPSESFRAIMPLLDLDEESDLVEIELSDLVEVNSNKTIQFSLDLLWRACAARQLCRSIEINSKINIFLCRAGQPLKTAALADLTGFVADEDSFFGLLRELRGIKHDNATSYIVSPNSNKKPKYDVAHEQINLPIAQIHMLREHLIELSRLSISPLTIDGVSIFYISVEQLIRFLSSPTKEMDKNKEVIAAINKWLSTNIN